MKYEDGFVAYLNGQEIAAGNVSGTHECQSLDTINRPDSSAIVFQDYDITDRIADLQIDTNVLAIHGINVSIDSSDLLILPELELGTISETLPGNLTIYYTTNGADPRLPGGAVNEPNAIEYTGPVTLTESTHVKSRVLDGNTWSALNEANFGIGEISLVINEFMAENDITIEDPNEPGEYPDWIELYNSGDTTLDLEGIYLTDDLTNKTKWQVPPGVTIEPGQYLLFWADSDDVQGDTHTNFKLSAGGEIIGLFKTDGETQIDLIVFGPQSADISFGRYPDAADDWGFCLIPTPNTTNSPHAP